MGYVPLQGYDGGIHVMSKEKKTGQKLRAWWKPGNFRQCDNIMQEYRIKKRF